MGYCCYFLFYWLQRAETCKTCINELALLIFETNWYTAISRKVVGKNVRATIPKGIMGYEQYTVPDTVAVESTFVAFLYHSQTYAHGLSCHSFKFLWRTVNSKPPTILFEIVACTFSDNLSRNSCIRLHLLWVNSYANEQKCKHDVTMNPPIWLWVWTMEK